MGNVFLINLYHRVAAGVGGALLGIAAGFVARGRMKRVGTPHKGFASPLRSRSSFATGLEMGRSAFAIVKSPNFKFKNWI